MPDLARMHCKPSRKEEGPLPAAKRRALHGQLPGWRLGARVLSKTWEMADFEAVLKAVGRVAALAEREQHHPDIHVERYRRLRIGLTTHAAGGLTLNDFVLAARIDAILGPGSKRRTPPSGAARRARPRRPNRAQASAKARLAAGPA